MNFSAEWLRCFFVKGKTRCGREEYAHLKSYRMSRFSIHLLHTHTHTQKKKKEESERTSRHVTSQSDKVGQRAPTSQKNGSRQMTYKHAHMLALKTVPRKGLSISRGWWQEKKKNTKREETVFQHACMGKYCSGMWKYSLIQVCDAFFFFSPRDVPMVNKMWRKQRLRTTTHGVNRQIFIPWKSWVIEKEGAARRYRVLLPTLWW